MHDLGPIGISFAFGFTLLGVIYALGPISGAHLNPAVSLAVFINGKMSSSEMFLYWIAQVVGGLIAGCILYLLVDFIRHDINVLVDSSFGIAKAAPNPKIFGNIPALFFEIIGTFLLVMVILGVTQSEKSSAFAGLVIGSTLVVLHLAGISLSGSAVNPVRAISTNIFVPEFYGYFWIYLIGPMIGGALAGILHYLGITKAID
tara:strand:- start:667 stop:1275 length:609 start_codon:yes stop_codon:yes gene_type:complete